jgi:23S rRNA (cytidine1920-2'-O)/16S rRNA (cytidine1409-2'-O)-methyltransferase
VLVGGTPALKPARLVSESERVTVEGPALRFVSRGGEKLEAALERFDVAVAGRRVLDAGASTGGFTDCVLQRGAAEVVAVDVGYGQLHNRLRADGRVVVLDRTNVRALTLAAVGGEAFDLLVADLSFISLRTVAAVLSGELAAQDADGVVLVKPQFEAGRAEASKGRGVIRSPALWRRALGEVCSTFASHGAAMMDAMVSPLTGPDGNVEFLVHVRPHAPDGRGADDVSRLLDAVVAGAAEREGRALP